MSAGWDGLTRELDAWAAAGRQATLWWRDDDAETWTPALQRLLDLAAGARTPVALAVIPGGAEETLARCLGGGADVAILQHGVDHANHAPAGEKSSELHDARPPVEMTSGLVRGRERLRALFAGAALPVMVPPWNRIGAGVVAALPGAGFTGLSTMGPRPAGDPAAGLRRVNVHVDIIDWRGGRGFVGTEAALAAATGHLRLRRDGAADADEPTGLLTHHLVHDDGCWDFIAHFVAHTRAHPAVRWAAAGDLWPGRAGKA